MRLILAGLYGWITYAQSSIQWARDLSPQGQLVSADTVFRLQKAPLILWMEARVTLASESDTVWVVVRSINRAPVIYALYRTNSNRMLYRGKIAFRERGIYYLSVCPPRQSRLILARGRLYITDAEAPTVAALRAQAHQQAQTIGPRELSSPDLSTLEELDLTPEQLLKEEPPPPMLNEEDLLEDSLDISIDLPEQEISEDDFELEDLELEDL
ncbi:MAG: hypothetical protein N3E49_02800 [Bacteroidia bacterium]|nr:hypothetical protein [Bacteroidia bacterium]